MTVEIGPGPGQHPNIDLPGPVELGIRADIAMSNIVYNEKVVGSSILEKLRHLDREFDTGIGNRRNVPSLGPVLKSTL